jgi:hypothetical protein
MFAAVPRTLSELLGEPGWAAAASLAVGVSACCALAVPLVLLHGYATVATFVALHQAIPWTDAARRSAPPRGVAWLAGPPYLTALPEEGEGSQGG